VRIQQGENEMIRNYKALGVAFAAVLALSAFMAQGAAANSGLTTEPEVKEVFVTGDQDGGKTIFTSPAHGGNVSCTEVTYKGSGVPVGGKVSHMTITPSYPTLTSGGANNCNAFGFPTHVINHDCVFTFTTPIGTATAPTWGTNEIHLVCSTGKGITITPTFAGASVCTQTIAAQTPTSGHVVGKNTTINGKMAVTLEITSTGIHFVGNGSVCGPNGVTTTDGTLTGNSGVRCFSDVGHVNQIGCTFS
jgi:hypothetical protein